MATHMRNVLAVFAAVVVAMAMLAFATTQTAMAKEFPLDKGSYVLNVAKSQKAYTIAENEDQLLDNDGSRVTMFLSIAYSVEKSIDIVSNDGDEVVFDLDGDGTGDLKAVQDSTDFTMTYSKAKTCSIKGAKTLTLSEATQTAYEEDDNTDKYFSEVTFVFDPTLEYAEVSGLKAKTYTGKKITQKPVVTFDGAKLKKGSDYTVSYKNNTNAGTATITFKGKGSYKGTKLTKTFTINKAANTFAAKLVKKKQTAKYGKKTTFKAAKLFKVTKNVSGGKVTYKKVSGKKKITITKAGKLTVKKGLKKGTYKVKVRLTAAATKNYKKATKTLTLKVKVK